MTREEFYETHCRMCGTQRCPADDEAISTCGYYNGDIEGIQQQESLEKLLKRLRKEKRNDRSDSVQSPAVP